MLIAIVARYLQQSVANRSSYLLVLLSTAVDLHVLNIFTISEGNEELLWSHWPFIPVYVLGRLVTGYFSDLGMCRSDILVVTAATHFDMAGQEYISPAHLYSHTHLVGASGSRVNDILPSTFIKAVSEGCSR